MPSVPTLAFGEYVRDRRSRIRTPIPMKLRPARSARRARRSYLTAVTFRQHFSAPLKIIRLLNKQGFSDPLASAGLAWLRRCSGEFPVSQGRVPWGKKGGSRIRYENRGRNIHRLLFRRSQHRKQYSKSNKSHRKQFFYYFCKKTG